MGRSYETIIIGAGPAGLIAGRHLRDALILDKKKEIGKPVQCGEGISKNALAMQGIKPDNSWICCNIHKVERIMPNGKAIGKFHKDPIGSVIDREKFEKYLAKGAKAEIKLNAKVTDLQFKDNLWEVILEDGEVFQSKYVIAADGPSSIIRRKVFPENQEKMKFIPTIEYLVEFENEINTKKMNFFLDNKRYVSGYAWIFTKSKNTANIGICGKGNFTENFKEFLESVVRKKYGNYNFLENKSGTIPLAIAWQKIYKNNVFLTGDAAGFADPIFKGGMTQAMFSAKLAARCILDGKEDNYELLIGAAPFANSKLIEASEIFYSLDNDTLNELGEILEEK